LLAELRAHRVVLARNELERAREAIGLSGYNFDFADNLGLWAIRAGFALSTCADTNLFQEAAMLDVIYQAMVVGKHVPLRDPRTGDITGRFPITDFQISPMGQTQYRNYHPISVDLKRTANERLLPR